MNKDFKEIAKKLGIAIPACLFSIGVVNAESATTSNNNIKATKDFSININTTNIVNNEVVKFLTTDCMKGIDIVSPDHTNYHSNAGGDHSDHHSNTSHTDSHANRDAKTQYNRVKQPDGTYQQVPSCIPHSNSHTNSGANVNRHTNSGNRYHTDAHTDKTTKPNC